MGRIREGCVGKQLARAADSIGANIAEAHGRFHFGEKIQFLYYARGSLFETKYWLKRARSRELMSAEEVEGYASRLADLARQLNAFAGSLKSQRYGDRGRSNAIRETTADYVAGFSGDASDTLFRDDDLEWLQSVPTEADLGKL